MVPSRSPGSLWERVVLILEMKMLDNSAVTEVDAVSPANRGNRLVLLSLPTPSLVGLLGLGLLISRLQT